MACPRPSATATSQASLSSISFQAVQGGLLVLSADGGWRQVKTATANEMLISPLCTVLPLLGPF